MGFHVIMLKEGNQITHEYVETIDGLANVRGLSEHSIIYQGERHWVPVVAGTEPRYAYYTSERFRAGRKAEIVFQRQAREHGYILEAINQDQDSFQAYTAVATEPIKRSDFLVRNAGHIEIDVKCRSFHRENGNRFIKFKISDFEKHINMSIETNAPVVIAVYQRLKDEINEDRLYMFEIGELEKDLSNIETDHDEHIGPYYKIPLAKTKAGFKLIEKYKNKLT